MSNDVQDGSQPRDEHIPEDLEALVHRALQPFYHGFDAVPNGVTAADAAAQGNLDAAWRAFKTISVGPNCTPIERYASYRKLKDAMDGVRRARTTLEQQVAAARMSRNKEKSTQQKQDAASIKGSAAPLIVID